MSDEHTTTETQIVQIVDLGRGPQIEGHRLTVMDVFYYLHRGYDFDFVHMAMPSLPRPSSTPSSNTLAGIMTS